MSNKEEDERPSNNDDEPSEEEEKLGSSHATPNDVLEEICKNGQILNDWLKHILKNPPKFDAFLAADNVEKNRFPNVLLYDKTRVRIKDKLGNDYYHASYVDSYEKGG